MSIRDHLNNLATTLEALQDQPAPAPEILDRGLSGNKINGGRITNFSSVGILDKATDYVLRIADDGISVKHVRTKSIPNPLTVGGDLTVKGSISATSLHVDEITADVRNERTSPLEFQGGYNQGLVWTGFDSTKSFVLQGGPDRLFSSESIDLYRGKEYKINNETVITNTGLGEGIVDSNLHTVGVLQGLAVDGNVTLDNFVRYDADTMRLGIGTLEPNAQLSVKSLEHEFIVDQTPDFAWRLGTWTTSALEIATDNTARIVVAPGGDIQFKSKTRFDKPIGVGVNNFNEDASITTLGPVRIQNKKFEVGDGIPSSGSYNKGDIIYTSNPLPTGYVGWICVRSGTPGTWKPFGLISE